MPSSLNSNTKFEILIFDLDDTLTDTEGQLVVAAREESIFELVKNGLKISIEKAHEMWSEYQAHPKIHKSASGRGDVFAYLVSEHMPKMERSALAQMGRALFYQREIPATFRAFSEAPEILSQLKTRYDLYLVTSGDVKTQTQKVAQTGLRSFFNRVFYVDHMKREKKGVAFREILSTNDVRADRILVIGNRVDHEISEGKTLGFKTCWVRRGEHRFQQPANPMEDADFKVDHIREIVSRCQL